VTEFPTAIRYHAYTTGFREQDMNEFFNKGVYNDIYGSGYFAYTIQSDKEISFRLTAVVKCLYSEEGDEWAAYVILYPQNLPELEYFPDGSYTVTLCWSSGSDSFSFNFKNDKYSGSIKAGQNVPPPNTKPQAVLPTGTENLEGVPQANVPPQETQAGKSGVDRITTLIASGPLAWLFSRGTGVKVYDNRGNPLPPGGSLQTGCTIVTDSNSTAQLYFWDGSVCNIGYGTSLTVRAFPGQDGEGPFFELNSGSFEIVSGEVRGEGTATVGGQGITCILGVRGTVYEVALNPEGSMEIRLFDGSIWVRSRSAQNENLSEEVMLEAGTYLVISPEGIPSEPMALSDLHYELASAVYGTPLTRPRAAGTAAAAPSSPGEKVPGWAWFLMGLGAALTLALAALSVKLLMKRSKAGA